MTIAIQYQFDSQQSFTRRFKAHFSMTPAAYRRAFVWNTALLQPPLELNMPQLPVPQMMDLPGLILLGSTYRYSCSLEKVGGVHMQIRKRFWHDFLQKLTPSSQVYYALTHYEAGEREAVEVCYTIATENSAAKDLSEVDVPAGKYACFHFDGPRHEYVNFAQKIYMYVLPKYGFFRREGQDIECFHIENNAQSEAPPYLKCDYLIPIVEHGWDHAP